jgi:glycogen debranching enzyme
MNTKKLRGLGVCGVVLGLLAAGVPISCGYAFSQEIHGTWHLESPNVRADAFVAGSWNGILFVVDDVTGFQVLVGSRAEGADLLDGDHAQATLTASVEVVSGKPLEPQQKRDLHPARNLSVFYESVTEVGPHAPDGSYCRLAWNPLYPYDTGSRLRLEWSRLDASTVLGRVTYQAPVNYMSDTRTTDLLLEAYSPLGFQAKYRLEGKTVVGASTYVPVVWEREWNGWKFSFSSNNLRLERKEEPGFLAGFWKPDYDDSHWHTVRWGAYWQEDPFVKERGYGWYRTAVVVPEELKGRPLRLDLGKVSQDDWTYLNGELVGQTKGADAVRQYVLAPGTPAYQRVRWGRENSVAVQVRSASDLGGISSGPYSRVVRLYPPPRPRLLALAQNRRDVNFVLVTNKPPDDVGAYRSIEDLRRQMQEKWALGEANGESCAGLLFNDLHMENFRRSRDNELYFVAKVGWEAESLLSAAAQRILSRTDLGQVLEERRVAYEAGRVQVNGGLAGAAEMVTNPVHWNVLYAPEQKRSFVVDSRRWFLPDHWTLWGNSAVMTAWAAALENKQLGEDTLIATLAEELPDGRVMNGAGSFVSTPDRTQDMYAAYAAWKIYRKWGDKEFLKQVYPGIRAWHEWWFADRGDGQPWRDGNRNGLLELGNNMAPFDAPPDSLDSYEYGLRFQGAMWEAYDDSPMWGHYRRGLDLHPPQYPAEDGVRFDYKTSTLNFDAFMPNALYALSCDVLARIAKELGYAEDEGRFERQYEQIKGRINQVLWDEKTGLYLNRFWESDGGQFSYRKSASVFYLMAAGVPDERQARRMVLEHLLNPKEFWGTYVLPSISRDDPTFPEQYYWRGTTWPPLNYFAYEGLKRYGYDDIAAQLVEKTYRLVKPNWDATGALWENYNSITGEGNAHGAGGSTKHYAWSAAFPLLSVMEGIDQEAWAPGLRFGSIGLKQQSRIQNLPIRGHRYDAIFGPELTELWRDGMRLFSMPTAGVVREFEWNPQHVSFSIKLNESVESAQISLGGLTTAGRNTALVKLDKRQILSAQIIGSEIVFTIPGGTHPVEITLAE